jgi:hypothetical protein
MKQPIANIVLQMDKNGSNVQRKNVTPAEVMLLCAMHHKNVGKDPVIKLEVIEEGAFDKEIEKETQAIEKLQADYARVEADDTVLENIKESRLDVISKRIEAKQSTIGGLKQIDMIRGLSPADEYRRLSFRYSQVLLKEFYPGRSPNLPTTFEEARQQGVQTEAVSPKWIVGDSKYANG